MCRTQREAKGRSASEDHYNLSVRTQKVSDRQQTDKKADRQAGMQAEGLWGRGQCSSTRQMYSALNSPVTTFHVNASTVSPGAFKRDV